MAGSKKAQPVAAAQGAEKAAKQNEAKVEEKGNILPGSADELHSMANEAVKKGEDEKATRYYTMAIDVLARGLKKDELGCASDADVSALNKSTDGQLVKLLSNRSLMHVKQGELPAAVEDAGTCTRADPTFEKGHLRLLAALEASGAPMRQLLEACELGLDACPESEVLVKRKWQLKKAIATTPSPGKPSEQEHSSPSIEETRRIADDPNDPRRVMAAADLGSILAVGGHHGVEKDVKEAERYLRIGAQGEDVGAMRNLGLLLLEEGRPAEAAEELSRAASAGDERALEVFKQLTSEADIRKAEARAKLEQLAAAGNQQAVDMLRDLDAQQ